MTELKPCPFCGGKDLQVVSVYGEEHYVYCYKCSACGSDGENYEEAIEAWNRRVNDA